MDTDRLGAGSAPPATVVGAAAGGASDVAPPWGPDVGPLALSPGCFGSRFLPHSREPAGRRGCAAAAGSGDPAPAEPW